MKNLKSTYFIAVELFTLRMLKKAFSDIQSSGTRISNKPEKASRMISTPDFHQLMNTFIKSCTRPLPVRDLVDAIVIPKDSVNTILQDLFCFRRIKSHLVSKMLKI